MKITPIQGELGRYLVRSESEPGVEYMVDLMAHGYGNRVAGECSCRDWTTRRGPMVKAKVQISDAVRCKHIKACIDLFAEEMLRAIYNDRRKRGT